MAGVTPASCAMWAMVVAATPLAANRWVARSSSRARIAALSGRGGRPGRRGVAGGGEFMVDILIKLLIN